ncbi:MAG: hypothetical protein GX596_10935 [Propionibacterium sp.]|nr:hypothetical protein [Propionibacterium sp.]
MRRLLTPCFALLGALSLLLGTLPAHADPQDPERADRALGWLEAQLTNGMLEQFPGHQDYGLTLDMVLSMRAAGATPAEVRPILDAMGGITESQLEYEGQPTTGMVGKALVAAHVSGYPVDDFHGKDLVAMARGAIDEDGRVDGGDTDAENIFSQAFVLIGLSQQGDVPPHAVDFLVDQQCEAGYFRLYYSDGQTCDEAGGGYDVDGTVLALFALEAALDAGHDVSEALDLGRRWLVDEQGESGGFTGSSSTPSENSNSTGLAVAALAEHHPEAAAKSAAWVASLMYSEGPDVGAVAYRAVDHDGWAVGEALTNAQRSGAIRATPQAVLAFAPTNYAFINAPARGSSGGILRPGLPPTGC